MKQIIEFINEKLIINKNTKIGKHHYHPKNKKELQELVDNLIDKRGNKADLNDIDTSEITDMSLLFNGWKKFNGDISEWDVSNVKDMQWMFRDSKFTGKNGDISRWDVSNVENISCMFFASKFNGDISKWDVSNVKTMNNVFAVCPLEKNPPKWYK